MISSGIISLSKIPRIVAAATILACPGMLGAAEPERSAPASTENAAPRKPLDLRAPDITKIFSPQELERVLARAIDPDIEEVEVEGARDRSAPEPSTPVVWPGLFAPFWALIHPTQAWRILAPMPPDQAQNIGNTKPDAMDPYRPAPRLP